MTSTALVVTFAYFSIVMAPFSSLSAVGPGPTATPAIYLSLLLLPLSLYRWRAAEAVVAPPLAASPFAPFAAAVLLFCLETASELGFY